LRDSLKMRDAIGIVHSQDAVWGDTSVELAEYFLTKLSSNEQIKQRS
jgi:hypothetical protein